MLALTGAVAHLLLGSLWIPWLLAMALFALVGVPQLSPSWLMRLLGGRWLEPHQAPALAAMIRDLAERAQLDRVPRLFWIPRSSLNAFAVGVSDDAAIAVTDGLLRTLNVREVQAVLAHEIAHVRAGDMRAMLLAEFFARITATFGSVGTMLAMMNLMLLVLGIPGVPWSAVVLLMASPSLSLLLQLALSRTRERGADLEAVRLTGDPRALASALKKIETLQGGLFEELVLRHRHGEQSSWLRSHPSTRERIETLLALDEPEGPPRSKLSAEPELFEFLEGLPRRRRRTFHVR